jgi:hypothetical protein
MGGVEPGSRDSGATGSTGADDDVPASSAALGRTIPEIVARLAGGNAARPEATAVLITPEGGEVRLDDGRLADTTGLFEREGVEYDEELSRKAEANAVAIMEDQALEVATLVMCGRSLVDSDAQDELRQLLTAGRQLHLYEKEAYVATLVGEAPEVSGSPE